MVVSYFNMERNAFLISGAGTRSYYPHENVILDPDYTSHRYTYTSHSGLKTKI